MIISQYQLSADYRCISDTDHLLLLLFTVPVFGHCRTCVFWLMFFMNVAFCVLNVLLYGLCLTLQCFRTAVGWQEGHVACGKS